LSDEMMIHTPDSSTGASDGYGVGNAILDEVRGAADYDTYSTEGVNDDAMVPAEYDSATDDGFDYLSEPVEVSSEPGPIPYERFKEVNDKAKSYSDRYEKWADVIQQFEQQGFQSAADIRRMQQQQQVEMQEESIRQRYHELQAQELVDPATAQLQLDAELQKFRYEQAMQEVGQYMAQKEREQAVQQFPLAQKASHLVDSLVNVGIKPTEAVKMVHEQIQSLQQSLLPELTKQVVQSQRTPTPQSQAGSAAPVVNSSYQAPQRMSLADLMGINRNRPM
jgi:hypothetical protein